MPDGAFTANKSGTVTVEIGILRRLLRDANDRAQLSPNFSTELKSKLSAKVVRVLIGPGSAIIRVEEWKFYWAEWLEAIDEAGN
jgi:hypothetical protein